LSDSCCLNNSLSYDTVSESLIDNPSSYYVRVVRSDMALLRTYMSRKDGGVLQSRNFGRTYPVP
jgi:hypothetical protein